MRVRLTHEMRVMPSATTPDVLELSPTLAARPEREDAPPPLVLPAGTRLDIFIVPAVTVIRTRAGCKACAHIEEVGKGLSEFDPDVALVHDHAR